MRHPPYHVAILFAFAALTGCGVASISPVVREEDALDEPRLIGRWSDSSSREKVVITSSGPKTYHLAYTDDAGKGGEFEVRAGRLGRYRVLDLQPEDPRPMANDAYKSLLLRAHGVVIIDSVGQTATFRLLAADSLEAYLTLHPSAVPHTLIDHNVLLTGSSAESRRFLTMFVGRPGALGEPNVWRRSGSTSAR